MARRAGGREDDERAPPARHPFRGHHDGGGTGSGEVSGQTIPAIRFVVTDREAYRPVRTTLLLIDEIRRQHLKEFAWGQSIDRLTGSDKADWRSTAARCRRCSSSGIATRPRSANDAGRSYCTTSGGLMRCPA